MYVQLFVSCLVSSVGRNVFVKIIFICFKISVTVGGMKFDISKKTNHLRDRSRPENHHHRRKLFLEVSYLQYWILFLFKKINFTS